MRRISVGRVNGRRFGFSAGVGLDAEAVRRIEERGRREDGARAGNLTFAWELARLVAQRRGRFDPALEVLGHGRAAFALVANGDPYTFAGPIPVRIAPEARFELGIDLVAPRAVSPLALPRLVGYALLGRGQAGASDVLYAHDLDRIEVVCDTPMPLQADGEDLGDVTSAIFQAEREAVTVLV
jgi:diacylglycerol kinase family enzyme